MQRSSSVPATARERMESALLELATIDDPSERIGDAINRVGTVRERARRLLQGHVARGDREGVRRVLPACTIVHSFGCLRASERTPLIEAVELAARMGLLEEAFDAYRQLELELDRTHLAPLVKVAGVHPGMRDLLHRYYQTVLDQDPDCVVASRAVELLEAL